MTHVHPEPPRPAGDGPMYVSDGTFDERALRMQRRAMWRHKRRILTAWGALAVLNLAARALFGPGYSFPIIAALATAAAGWIGYEIITGDARRIRARMGGGPTPTALRISDDGLHVTNSTGAEAHVMWKTLRSFALEGSWISIHPRRAEPIIVLPDADLSEGSREDVEQLLRANLKEG